MNFRFSQCVVLLIVCLSFSACQKDRRERILGKPVLGDDAKPGTLQEIAPLTTNALGARQDLHKNGWKFIPSTQRSLALAEESSTMTARHAMAAVLVRNGSRIQNYPSELSSAIREVREWGVDFEKSEIINAQILRENSWKFAKDRVSDSGRFGREARSRLITGYILYFERTDEDFAELKNLPGNYYSDLNQDFSNLYTISGNLTKSRTEKISSTWKNSFDKGLAQYQKSYKESGDRDNSLLAIVDLFGGYTMALSEFLIRPLGTTLVSSGEVIVWDGILLPLSTSSFFAGRTVKATGLTLYYTSRVGVKTISPTVEAGYLTTLSLASASISLPAVLGGETLSAFNQVTIVTSMETARATGTVGALGYKSGEAVLGLAYDFTEDSSVSVLYGLKTGVVLGYTALTVIPTHLILAAPDSVFFLAWDGPRLVIAQAKGNLKEWGDLPAGAIVDLEQARKMGLDAKIVSEDPKLIRKVLEAQDADLLETKKSKKIDKGSKK